MLKLVIKQAIESIVIPRYEADGTKTEQRVSETLKAKLDDSNLKATVNTANKTLTVDTQLKDVYLASDYLNVYHQQVKATTT